MTFLTALVRKLPNVLTVLRILMTPFLFILAQHKAYGTAAIVFFVSSWTDFFDGRIARRFHATTPLGTVLDPVADKLFVLFSYLALWGDCKLLPILVISRDIAIVLGVAIARVQHLDLPIKPLMVSKINTGFAMLFPFAWLLIKIHLHGTPSEQKILPILIACGLAMITAWGSLMFIEKKERWSTRKACCFTLIVSGLAFCFFIWEPVKNAVISLLCPEFLTALAGVVVTTTVASGIAYALGFLRAWKAKA